MRARVAASAPAFPRPTARTHPSVSTRPHRSVVTPPPASIVAPLCPCRIVAPLCPCRIVAPLCPCRLIRPPRIRPRRARSCAPARPSPDCARSKNPRSNRVNYRRRGYRKRAPLSAPKTLKTKTRRFPPRLFFSCAIALLGSNSIRAKREADSPCGSRCS